MKKSQPIYEIAARLEALGNETRLKIFQLLVQAGPSGLLVGKIQKHLSIPGSTLSHHIARLVSVNLVEQERISRSLICRANYSSMDSVITFLTENCCAMETFEQEKSDE